MTEPKKKPNRKQRAIKRRERTAQIPRVPTHGEVPDPAAGWVADRPTDDPSFRIVHITTVRFSDGFVQKFYQMLMRTEELERKRELAKKKLKQVLRENREAEQRQKKRRKRELRAVLALVGRS
jgi:hypothetical protein